MLTHALGEVHVRMHTLNLCTRMIYAHILSAHVHTCIYMSVHTIYTYTRVLHAHSVTQTNVCICSFPFCHTCLHFPILFHTPHISETHPTLPQGKALHPLAEHKRSFSCIFFSNGIQGSEWPSTLLCMAVHKDSMERPWVKTCKAGKHSAHTDAPVTLATGQSLTHSMLPSLEVEGSVRPICTHCPAPACRRLVPSSKGPWMPSAVSHGT